MENSELRQDLVSGEWIIIAPKRGGRPHDFLRAVPKRKKMPAGSCPFENPQKTGHERALLAFPDVKNWELQIIPNRYPALVHKKLKAVLKRRGAYRILPGLGHHELLITRAHDKNFSELSPLKAFHVFEAFRDRYLALTFDQNIAYVSIFQNWGPTAGASIYHPHYQIIAMPVVPPDVTRSLAGSAVYFKKHKTCVHCAILKQEKKDKKRVIFENSGAIAFSPFASPNSYEVAVFPKKHLSFFENTLGDDLASVAEALKFSLHKIKKNLKDPDYNFFLHTSPVKQKENYKHYHWHIELLPKFSVLGGFEFGTGATINVVDPDEAAKVLRR